MAEPQTENGYLKIANELFDALCHTRIPGEARLIWDTIIRKTYGYGKKEDAIALSQFCSATGLNKQHVCQGIAKLKNMNLVTVKGNDIANIYCINKDFDTWKPLPKKVTLPNTVKIVTEKGNKSLPNTVHTKDNITKDNKDIGSISLIIQNMNAILGTVYKTGTPKTRTLITTRMKEGFTVEDFGAVVKWKNSQWKDEPKMEAFLRPETLFGTKFEGYLNEALKQNPKPKEINPPSKQKETMSDRIYRERMAEIDAEGAE